MQYILTILIFFWGAALGSFVNVIVDRYNTGLSFLKGRSVCFSCNTGLEKKDLIPIFSFLFLKGRCRQCKSKIPPSSFMIEIVMGMLTLLAFQKAGLTWEFLILTSIFGVILLISVYDLRHFIIPDSFLIFLFIFSVFYLFVLHDSGFIIQSLLSGLVLTLPFLLIFLISKGTWFGFGDVKYIAVLGFWLGLPGGISAVMLAFWTGAAFFLAVLAFKKISPRPDLPWLRNNLTIKSEVPFGPFLSVGALMSFYFGADILQINELFNFI